MAVSDILIEHHQDIIQHGGNANRVKWKPDFNFKKAAIDKDYFKQIAALHGWREQDPVDPNDVSYMDVVDHLVSDFLNNVWRGIRIRQLQEAALVDAQAEVDSEVL